VKYPSIWFQTDELETYLKVVESGRDSLTANVGKLCMGELARFEDAVRFESNPALQHFRVHTPSRSTLTNFNASCCMRIPVLDCCDIGQSTPTKFCRFNSHCPLESCARKERKMRDSRCLSVLSLFCVGNPDGAPCRPLRHLIWIAVHDDLEDRVREQLRASNAVPAARSA